MTEAKRRRYRARYEHRDDVEVLTVGTEKGQLQIPVAKVACVVCGLGFEMHEDMVFTAGDEWVWLDGAKVPLGWPRHPGCTIDQMLHQAVAVTMISAVRRV